MDLERYMNSNDQSRITMSGYESIVVIPGLYIVSGYIISRL
jgi:hypothetical protein